MGYVADIERATRENEDFRKVLFTTKNSQLVLMTLQPNEDIGMEVHEENDQFIRVEEGEGKAILDGEEHEIRDGFAIVVPAGTEHDIVNTSPEKKMRLYTIYSPAHHPDGTVHRTKADAEMAEADERSARGEAS